MTNARGKEGSKVSEVELAGPFMGWVSHGGEGPEGRGAGSVGIREEGLGNRGEHEPQDGGWEAPSRYALGRERVDVRLRRVTGAEKSSQEGDSGPPTSACLRKRTWEASLGLVISLRFSGMAG